MIVVALLPRYQKQVSGKIRDAYRFHGLRLRVSTCLDVIKYVGRSWQSKYFKIKFARIAGTIITAQALAQSILARATYKRRLAVLERERFLESKIKLLQKAWRVATARKNWKALFVRSVP